MRGFVFRFMLNLRPSYAKATKGKQAQGKAPTATANNTGKEGNPLHNAPERAKKQCSFVTLRGEVMEGFRGMKIINRDKYYGLLTNKGI
jgi:hypothetical protein